MNGSGKTLMALGLVASSALTGCSANSPPTDATVIAVDAQSARRTGVVVGCTITFVYDIRNSVPADADERTVDQAQKRVKRLQSLRWSGREPSFSAVTQDVLGRSSEFLGVDRQYFGNEACENFAVGMTIRVSYNRTTFSRAKIISPD